MSEFKRVTGKELKGEIQYAPKVDFSDLVHTRDVRHRQKMVEERLIDLAEKNELCVTDLLNQPEVIRNTCGMILDGEKWKKRNGASVVSGMCPPELSSYMVRIKSLPKTIADPERKKRIVKEPVEYPSIRFALGYEEVFDGNPNNLGEIEKPPESDMIYADYGKSEADVPLPYAWKCLSQMGKNCAPAKTRSAQMLFWKVEEIFPKPKVKAK